MGFEEVIPPIPTRQQELEFIENLEKEFKAQPSYKFYMNEAVRRNKIEYSKKLNTYRLNFLMHFSIGIFFIQFFF